MKFFSGCCVAAGVLMLSGPLQADDSIIVRGRYLSLDKVNAVKVPTPLVDIPQSVSIVSAGEIERQWFMSVADIVQYTPGISASQGEGHRDAVIIRGQLTTADFFLDGLRDDVQYFRPLYNLEQVEILKGANALLFGRGGTGGVINRVRKKPVHDETFTGLSAGSDTFGAYSFSADHNTVHGSRFASRLNMFYTDHHDHRDFYEGRSYGFNPEVSFRAGPDTTLRLSYEYLDDSRVVDRGVPSQETGEDIKIPLEGYDDTFFGSPDGNLTTLRAHILSARADHVFSPSLRGNLSMQYADYDKFYRNLYPAASVYVEEGIIPATETVVLDGYRDTTDRQNFIIQGNLVGEFRAAGTDHTVLFGIEAGNQDTDNARYDDDVFFEDGGDGKLEVLFTDPLHVPELSYSLQIRDRQSGVRFMSVYFQDQIDITPWLSVVGGVRYDRFDIDVLDFIDRDADNGSDGAFGRVDSRWTPRGGVLVKPLENFSVYFSYSETFLPRSGEQFLILDPDSENTRPQITVNTEAGIKWDIRPDLAFTAAVFDLDRESYTSVSVENPGTLDVIAGSGTKGIELQLAGAVTSFWRVTAGYSYLDGRVVSGEGGAYDGNSIRQLPENMFSLWNDIRLSDRWGAGAGFVYQDSFFAQEDNTVEIPDFFRIDAAVYHNLNARIRLQANIGNLTNTDYYPDAYSNTNISTGKPLNVRFTVTGRF